MIKLELPVYWSITKKQQTLIGMNWYQRANRFQINEVKKAYHELIRVKLLSNKEKIKGSYQVRYKYFYKNDRELIIEMNKKYNKVLKKNNLEDIEKYIQVTDRNKSRIKRFFLSRYFKMKLLKRLFLLIKG